MRSMAEAHYGIHRAVDLLWSSHRRGKLACGRKMTILWAGG